VVQIRLLVALETSVNGPPSAGARGGKSSGGRCHYFLASSPTNFLSTAGAFAAGACFSMSFS
jgi:hypothetical protein